MRWASSAPGLATPSAPAPLPARSSEAAPGSAVHHLQPWPSWQLPSERTWHDAYTLQLYFMGTSTGRRPSLGSIRSEPLRAVREKLEAYPALPRCLRPFRDPLRHDPSPEQSWQGRDLAWDRKGEGALYSPAVLTETSALPRCERHAASLPSNQRSTFIKWLARDWCSRGHGNRGRAVNTSVASGEPHEHQNSCLVLARRQDVRSFP